MKEKTYSLLIYLLLTLLILCLVSLAIIFYIESQEQDNKVELVKTCRTVTVYDYNGQEIESWSGRFDIYQKNPTNSVYFDTEEGKRVYINGGIIICEDK